MPSSSTMWAKGQSGNPGGRPKGDVAALARQHTAAAIEALVDALRSPKERVPAAVALLNRGWGQAPLQVQQLDEDGNPAAAAGMVVRVQFVGEAAPPLHQAQQASRPALPDAVRNSVKLVG